LNLTVKSVSVTFFHQTWPLVEHFLADALKWGEDDYTVEQAKTYLARGDWLLLVAVDEENSIHGAAAVNFNNMPNDRVAFITAIGGKLISSKEVFEQFCKLLKTYGATKVQGAARESVARLWAIKYGFKERYRIVEVKI
jgi:hypothetical protein